MEEKISALLVSSEDEPFEALAAMLRAQAVEVFRAAGWREAARFLEGSDQPRLVFTDTTLADGTWADVLSIALKARQPPSVIVVSRWVDIKTHIDAIERGAFDYIVPPFLASDLAHVVRSAAWKASHRQDGLAAAA